MGTIQDILNDFDFIKEETNADLISTNYIKDFETVYSTYQKPNCVKSELQWLWIAVFDSFCENNDSIKIQSDYLKCLCQNLLNKIIKHQHSEKIGIAVQFIYYRKNPENYINENFLANCVIFYDDFNYLIKKQNDFGLLDNRGIPRIIVGFDNETTHEIIYNIINKHEITQI